MTALPYHQEAEETILAACMLSPAADRLAQQSLFTETLT
jgi:hypothetical protein